MLLKLEIGLCSVIHKGRETEFSHEKAGGKAMKVPEEERDLAIVYA